jgi:Na+/proline symporter
MPPSCPYCRQQLLVGVHHWCREMQAADNEATRVKKATGGGCLFGLMMVCMAVVLLLAAIAVRHLRVEQSRQ